MIRNPSNLEVQFMHGLQTVRFVNPCEVAYNQLGKVKTKKVYTITLLTIVIHMKYNSFIVYNTYAGCEQTLKVNNIVK